MTPPEIVFGVDDFESAKAKQSPNRCVAKYGRGPEGKKCRECVAFFVRETAVKNEQTGRTIRKAKYACKESPIKNHEPSFDACSLFEQSAKPVDAVSWIGGHHGAHGETPILRKPV